MDICYSTRIIKVDRKFSIPWTSTTFIDSPEKPAEVVRIAKTTILFPNDSLDIPVSNYFPPNNPFLVSSNSSKIINQFLPQEVKSVGYNIKLSNLSSEPLILEKNMHAFIVRAMK